MCSIWLQRSKLILCFLIYLRRGTSYSKHLVWKLHPRSRAQQLHDHHPAKGLFSKISDQPLVFRTSSLLLYNSQLQVLSQFWSFSSFFYHLNRSHSYLNFNRSTKIRSALNSRMQRRILDSFPMKILSYGLHSCLCHQR